MELHPESSKALDRWLVSGNWHKSNDPDMNKFYEFINQYQKEYGYYIEELELQREIVSRANAEENDALLSIIRERVNLAVTILDFLKQTAR